MMLKIFDLNSCEKIPPQQGVYAFFLNCFTMENLGLLKRENEDYSLAQLENAKKLIIRKAERIYKLYSLNNLSGFLNEENKAAPGMRLKLIAEENRFQDWLRVLESIENEELPGFVNLFSSIIMLQRPIYCGITKRQTLRSRYHQHFSDYNSEKEKNSFGNRMKLLGFEWDDIKFACVPFVKDESHVKTLDKIERLLMLVSNPALSQR